jgi:hypothetical protein
MKLFLGALNRRNALQIRIREKTKLNLSTLHSNQAIHQHVARPIHAKLLKRIRYWLYQYARPAVLVFKSFCV